MKFWAVAATSLLLGSALATSALAAEPLRMERKDDTTVVIVRDDAAPATFWFSKDTTLDSTDVMVARDSKAKRLDVYLPKTERDFVIVQRANQPLQVVGERLLPLEMSSNFRDLGGYQTKDGRTVRWGKAFRSGAMPLLTESDYSFLGKLGLGTVVDLRSLEEREIAPDLLDDRTGALFISNDYSMKPMLAKLATGSGENMYQGTEELLVPQIRATFRRLLADDGALVYHCSAGQDRTGVVTAMIYEVLGVDRETILKDYHLSTSFRRTVAEMPPIKAEDYPGNVMAKFIAASQAKGGGQSKPEPLYTPSGKSHLAQFFAYLDKTYGGAEGYLKQKVGLTEADFQALRAKMLI